MRNKRLILLFLLSVIIVSGFVLPKFLLKDNTNISLTDRNCAILESTIMLDNPFQRLFTIKITADEKSGNKLHTSAYTLFGIKYANVEVECGGGGRIDYRL